MRKFQKTLLSSVPVVCLALTVACFAQTTSPTDNQPDLSKEPTLYVVGYAHLDTEWRWEYPQVINEYLRKTIDRKSTRLNSSHVSISYAVFCLKKKTKPTTGSDSRHQDDDA